LVIGKVNDTIKNGITRLVIVGAKETLREGLSAIIANEPTINVLYTCPDISQAIEKSSELKPDVMLLITGPSRDIAESIHEIGNKSPSTKVVLLTCSCTATDVMSAIGAGATGYLSTNVGVDELVKDITLAAAGQMIISPLPASVLQNVVFNGKNKPEYISANNHYTTLTRRETEILELMANGSSNEDIAAELCISKHTVKAHVHNIIDKFNVKNRQQAVAQYKQTLNEYASV
jgi:DNA-binding NarL/FixJ family response regulator